jgi:phosphatidylglycerol:prolipoprotein diacylglycerol transferase
VKPIPVQFHIGPLVVHTYGIGLAITFYIAYKLFQRRLKNHNYPTEWLNSTFIWVVVFAILGARLVHVIANFGQIYEHNLIQIVEIWKGGLSSYGGLLGGFSAGIYKVKKALPRVNWSVLFDLVSPVLVVSWAIGRLLGPQLMIAGGGKPTNAWYGMYYADEVGKRLPVPIFQAIECFVIFLIVLQIEKYTNKGPAGATALSAVILWNISRFFDEYLYLDTPSRLWDAVEVASVFLVAIGSIWLYVLVRRWYSLGCPQPTHNYDIDAKNSDIQTTIIGQT